MKIFLPILALGLVILFAEPALAQDAPSNGGGFDLIQVLIGAATLALIAFLRAVSNSIPDSKTGLLGVLRSLASLFTGKTPDKTD